MSTAADFGVPTPDGAGGFVGGVESTMGFADAPVPELRDRILRAMRYTFSWQSAIDDAALSPAYRTDDVLATKARGLAVQVAAMQDALKTLLDLIPPNGEFVGIDQKAAYERTSAGFAQLYRDLALSLATLPQRSLLDQLGDLGSAVFKAPAAAVKTLAEQTAQTIRDALGGTLAAIWSNLWPFLLVAGGAGLIYIFRAPLLRAVAKVSA